MPLQEGTIPVCVNSLGGPLCDFKASKDWRILDVKYQIQKKSGIPWFRQQLVVGVDEVRDNTTRLMDLCADGCLQVTMLTLSADSVSWIKKLAKLPRLLSSAPEEVQDDQGIMLRVAQMNGLTLQFMHDRYRQDREVVLCAVRSRPEALQYCLLDISNDEELILYGVQRDWRVFSQASSRLRAARDTVLEVVKWAGLALQFASKELRSDRDIILAAVSQDGRALSHAEIGTLDHEILQAAVKSKAKGRFFDGISWDVLQHPAVLGARRDFQFMLSVVQQDPLALKYADASLRSNWVLVSTAIQKRGCALEFAGDDLRKSPEMVMLAVRRDGLALGFAAESLRSNQKLVMAAVRQDAFAIQFASDGLRNNPIVLQAAMCG